MVTIPTEFGIDAGLARALIRPYVRVTPGSARPARTLAQDPFR